MTPDLPLHWFRRRLKPSVKAHLVEREENSSWWTTFCKQRLVTNITELEGKAVREFEQCRRCKREHWNRAARARREGKGA